MRISLLFVLMISCPDLFAQEDSMAIKFAPTLTEIGKPAGEKVSQKFDKDGGEITSSDGRMELMIPPDALSSKTTVSIQPVMNTLSPGKAQAYQLSPSGITFQKPLQIIFHYSSKEAPAMPELRGIAWQDDKGQWSAIDSSVVDTLKRTVSGYITHFSTWLFFDYFSLEPAKARVKVTHQLNLMIVCTYPGRSGMFTKETIPKNIRFSTYVNGVRGGNAVVGTVSNVAGQDIRNIKYTAPATVPDNNPVALSVEASNITFNRITYSKLKLISNITVFDRSFEVTVIGYNKQHAASCTVSSIDSSSFVLQLNGSRTKIVDIQNMNVVVTSSGCPCKVTEINKGNNSGPIDIVGATKIDVEPANPPQKPYPFIRIYFIRTVGIIPGWHAPPCGHINDVVTPPMALPAIPFLLAFEGKDQAYSLGNQGGSDNGFEIKVKPVKEDQ